MREKMPLVVRILAILAGIAIFVATIITFVVGLFKLECPEFLPFIIISALLLVVAIVLPLILRRKVLIVLTIFSALTLVTSTVLYLARPLIQEAYDMVSEMMKNGDNKQEQYTAVADPDTASLTAAQVKQRTDSIWSTTQGVYRNMQFDRVTTVQRHTNRQTTLYNISGDRYNDSDLGRKKIPDSYITAGNLSLYTSVYNDMPRNPKTEYSYWANGPLGFIMKINEKGKINNSVYSLDKYTYFCAEGLIERQEYRIFVTPDEENPEDIFDYQAIYKYDLRIHSK